METTKVKCPWCGSEDVIIFVEELVTYYYKIKKNGERYKNYFDKNTSDSPTPMGYKCNKCEEVSLVGDMESWEEITNEGDK